MDSEFRRGCRTAFPLARSLPATSLELSPGLVLIGVLFVILISCFLIFIISICDIHAIFHNIFLNSFVRSIPNLVLLGMLISLRLCISSNSSPSSLSFSRCQLPSTGYVSCPFRIVDCLLLLLYRQTLGPCS